MHPENKSHIEQFLALKSIAIAGISRSGKPGNAIFKKFVTAGFDVVGIHPQLTEFEGRPCFPSVTQVPGAVEGLFLITNPAVTLELTQQAIAKDVRFIWMHNMTGIHPAWGESFTKGNTSVSEEAVDLAKEAGITVIPGSCPMQHIQPVDIFHRCIHWVNERKGA